MELFVSWAVSFRPAIAPPVSQSPIANAGPRMMENVMPLMRHNQHLTRIGTFLCHHMDER